MDLNIFIKNFEEAIEGIEQGSITPETEFKKIEQWNSLAVLTLMAMVDSEFGVELTVDEIVKKCNTVSQLFELIISKKN
jgi:acyl carrier protein